MTILFLALAVLAIVAATIGYLGKDNTVNRRAAEDHDANCSSCTSSGDKCEQECLLETFVSKPEYFDDEELDRYANRPSDSYNEDEVDEFSEILYTLSPGEEVKAWSRSLTVRGINLPDELKDELIMLSDNPYDRSMG